jgi:PhzF family phenazine biosynthesis protein
MQSVAAENNLSETAFVTYNDDGSFGIRWFTPTTEVDLCGHATLAAACTLMSEGIRDGSKPIVFHCSAHGELVCGHTRHGVVDMEFPADSVIPADPPVGLIQAVGVEPVELLKGREDYLFVVDSPEQVEQLTPDFRLLAEIDARGVIVTASSEGKFDIVSRCFFPRFGIDEDPVTGSAHCTLGPYWIQQLGKEFLTCWQASSRGGEVWVTMEGETVTLQGRAVMAIRGELLV